MADELTERYRNLLDGCYDCVDRIVLNAYNSLCYSAGGFRTWWRRLMDGSDEQLDNAHLMRMAGRFSRRVRGFAKAHHIPVIDCRRGERKHDIAEGYLAEHSVQPWTVHDPRRPRSGPGLGRPAFDWRRYPPDQEVAVRESLLVPHHGRPVGSHHHQD